ncbi:rod shape-determining protein RodA [Bacillus sp. FSL W7-1360]
MEKRQSQIDYTLLFLLFLLMCISFIAIYSGSGQYYSDDPTFFLKRQVVWYVVGIMVMVAVMVIDFDYFKYLSIPAYGFGMLLLILVPILGKEENGAKRWLFGVQPSEFMKIFLVLALAHLLYKIVTKERYRSVREDIWLLIKIAALSVPPFLLILMQPDLGTSLVIVAIVGTMVLVSGVRWRLLFALAGAAVAGLALLVYLHEAHFEIFKLIVKDHQLQRIYGWLDPMGNTGGFGYQLYQAMLGIGSGQLSGMGLFEGVQTQGHAVPEIHTDFIFTVIGEESGFLGAMILLFVYFLLFYRMITIAMNCNNLYGTYLVAGIVGLLVFQVFQNVAMTIGLMPITGLALPFISYGGSALLTNMVAIGIVMNVRYRTKDYMFRSEEGDGV